MDRYRSVRYALCILCLCFLLGTVQQKHLAIIALNRVPAVGGGCPGSYCEDFESTGTPTDWSGSGDFDNTISPLVGIQDILLETNETAIYDPSFNAPTLYIAFRMKFADSLENQEGVVFFGNTTGTGIGTLGVTAASADWRCIGTSSTAGTGGDPSADGLFSTGAIIKALFVKSTGTDGIVRLWTWNGATWIQQCETVNHQAVNNVDRLMFINNASPETMQIDHVITSVTDILTPTF